MSGTGSTGYIGGLIGRNTSGNIQTATVKGNTSGTNYTGGLIGENASSSATIASVTVEGNVTGTGTTGYVGGLIGLNASKNMTNATVTGNTTGVLYVGGLIGKNNSTSYTFSTLKVTGDVEGTGTGGYVGGLIGQNYGIITGAEYAGNVYGIGSFLGGLIGKQESGEINTSKTSGQVIMKYSSSNYNSTKQNAGGLVGYNNGQTISKCYSSSDVLVGESTTKWSYIGGLVGNNYRPGKIEKSAATGDVTANTTDCSYIGGLVGYNYGTADSNGNRALVENSYSTGKVAGGTYVGGLIGYTQYGQITNSYTVSRVTGYTTGGLIGDVYSTVTSGSTRNWTTVTNSYWTKEQSGQSSSKLGTVKTVTWLINRRNLTNVWDMEETWGIDDRKSLPYINGITVPNEVYVVDNGYVTYAEGDGTQSNPYIITTEGELRRMADVKNAYYRLEADIELTGVSGEGSSNWTAVGNSSEYFYRTLRWK